jgi:hypothetical protein
MDTSKNTKPLGTQPFKTLSKFLPFFLLVYFLFGCNLLTVIAQDKPSPWEEAATASESAAASADAAATAAEEAQAYADQLAENAAQAQAEGY